MEYIDLDELAGAWQEDEFDRAMADFERVDEEVIATGGDAKQV